ncbi:hypothetical protein Tco_0858660 [Tanacetum coccineum]|uniref:Uncharacterized protein n=1 Tax=Tanacetum coccineum TaxID=301880 RepID=A0ABQ5BAS2_9ASTR
MSIEVSLADALSKLVMKRKHDDVPSAFPSNKRMKSLSCGSRDLSNRRFLQTIPTDATHTDECLMFEDPNREGSNHLIDCPQPIVASERKKRGRPRKNNISKADTSVSNFWYLLILWMYPLKLSNDPSRSFTKVVVADLKQPHNKCDFNLIRELSDKVEGLSNLHHIKEFQNFTAASRLIDIPYTGLKYTWSNQRNKCDNIRERIDRALGKLVDIPYTGLKYTWSNQRNECDNIYGFKAEGGSNPKMPKFKNFITSDETLSEEDFKVQLKEMKRLEDLKAEKEKIRERTKEDVQSSYTGCSG